MMKDYLSNQKAKKWIAFLMAIVMVFLAIPNYQVKAADAVPLDVNDYKGDRAQTEWTIPTQTGKVFAGWYTDDTYSTIYTKTTGTAYPKFVDASVLTVKKQLKAKTTSASKTTDIRFITSIDTANFSYVGFEVEVNCEPVIKFDLQERTAYSSIVAKDQTLSNAARVFGTSDSKYFVTHSITGIPNAVFNNTFTVKPYWYTLDGTKVYGTTRSFAISDDLCEDSLVANKVTVNDTTFDMSEVIKFIDGPTAPVDGYYNYHITNKTVTNLCNANRSIFDAKRKVLYLNKVLTGSFTFETTIDMSSLDEQTDPSYARQGIVLSNGTKELAIFLAKNTTSNKQDNTIYPTDENGARTGYWYIHNGTTGALVTDAGRHVGVGKCVSTNYASEITLKVEKIGNSHINLYVEDELITVLKPDGFYKVDGTKSSNTTFNNDLAALIASEEMVIGLNHFNALNYPGIIYSNIKFEEGLVTDKVTVNGKTFDMSSVIKYIDGDDKPVTGYYNYHLTNETVTNLCNNKYSITDTTRKVLYLNKVLTGSFTFETTIDMSSLDKQTNPSYARQGIVLSNGTNELAIFLAKNTTSGTQDNSITPIDKDGARTGYWYIHNGTTGALVTDAGRHVGVGKCVSTNYASKITLKVEKIGNSHINLYVEDELITVLKPDGFYKADGTQSSNTTFNNDLAALIASEEMVIGLNHFNALNFPKIVYKDIKFNHMEEVYLSSTNGNDSNTGSKYAPVATLSRALDVVACGGTIVVCDDYIVPSDFKWEEKNNTLTIMGDDDDDNETLSFTNFSENVGIGDNVTFDHITLGFNENTNFFANGYKLVIGEHVTTTNPIKLYGGGNRTAVTSTNLTILSGDYYRIYGGSYIGTVTGDTTVYIGGTTNAIANPASHDDIYNVFGGGYYDTIKGNTYLTFTDKAKANFVYGGSYGTATVTGTNVIFSGGKSMSLYGGNYSHNGVSSTKVWVTGGEMEQLFGANQYASMTGEVVIELTGGKITRRVYGGCYNDYGWSGWGSSYYVNGTINLNIASGVDISLDASYSDRAIYACSRYGTVNDGEKCTITFMDATAYAVYSGKLGAADSTMKNIMKNVNSSVESDSKYYTLILDDKESLVVNKVTVNDVTFDMSNVIKYIDGDTKPVNGYYNYHVTNKTVTNLCNNKHSITDATRKVLYLNKVFTDSFTFETTIDMSSLDNQTGSPLARQGIVLSNGTTELAIFPATWTDGNVQDNNIETGTGYWYVHNGTTGDFITDAGMHDGVGKSVSTNYASKITLKVEKIGNSHINLYANGKLVTVLKADGFYNAADDSKSKKYAFDNDLAALFASEEMVIGLNHFNALDFPNIVYKDIKMDNVE